MRFLNWLRRLFGWKPAPTSWDQAVRVTDPARLAKLARIYAEQVAWCRERGFVIQSPDCLVTLREWPDGLRSPFGIAKVLPPNAITGDTHGTLLLHEGVKDPDESWLMAHESKHAITGISDHPKDLFPT